MPLSLQMFYALLGKKSNSIIRSRSATRSKFGVMSNQWRMSLYVVIIQNAVEREGHHIVWYDPRTDHRTSLETTSNVPLHIPARVAYFKVHCPQNKIFIRGGNPGVSDELWDKNAIDGRILNVATQERKVCNMEIKLVTLVVKGNGEVDRTYWLAGVNPNRKQEFCSKVTRALLKGLRKPSGHCTSSLIKASLLNKCNRRV